MSSPDTYTHGYRNAVPSKLNHCTMDMFTGYPPTMEEQPF